MENADDLETTPATSLNNNPAVTKIGLDMAKRAFSDATNAGLRVNHYGTTVNNPIGRAYFGLFNAVPSSLRRAASALAARTLSAASSLRKLPPPLTSPMPPSTPTRS